jgi:hypothetical protein
MLQKELTKGINATPMLKAFHKWQRSGLALQPLATKSAIWVVQRWDYSFDAQFSTEYVSAGVSERRLKRRAICNSAPSSMTSQPQI